MSEVVELVQYKLKAGVDIEVFVKSMDVITNWTHAQAGFQFRSGSVDDDGTWSEIMYWASMDEAKAAHERFMQDNGHTPFMTMIDPSTVKMSHGALKVKAMAK